MSSKRKYIPRAQNARGAKIYIRNSGREESNIAKPETQLAYCVTVVERLDATFDPTRDIYDEGSGLHSAYKRTNLDRFDDMIAEAIADPHCRYVVSYDSARVFRNLPVGVLTLQLLERNGIEWHTYSNARLSMQDENDRMRTQFQLMVDQEESLRASRRIREKHYAPLRAAGIYFSHHAPIGLNRVGSAPDKTLHWETNDDFPLVIEIITLYVRGHGSPTIAALLRHRTWGKHKRPLGFFLVKGVLRSSERYRDFLDPLLYQQFCAQRAARKNHMANGNQPIHPVLLLKGLVYCDYCGEKLRSETTKKNKGHHKVYRWYAHQIPRVCPSKKRQSALQIDASFWQHLSFLENLPDEHRAIIKSKLLTPKESSAAETLTKRKRGLEKEIEALARMRAQEEITASEFARAASAARDELKSVHDALDNTRAQIAFTEAQADMILNARIADLQQLQAADPDAFNKWLQSFIVRVTVRDNQTVNIKFFAPFDELSRSTDGYG